MSSTVEFNDMSDAPLEPTEPNAAAIETDNKDGASALCVLENAGRGREPGRCLGVMRLPPSRYMVALGSVDP